MKIETRPVIPANPVIERVDVELQSAARLRIRPSNWRDGFPMAIEVVDGDKFISSYVAQSDIRELADALALIADAYEAGEYFDSADAAGNE